MYDHGTDVCYVWCVRAMAKRIGAAQQKLERILSRRDPRAMESEIAMMTRRYNSMQ